MAPKTSDQIPGPLKEYAVFIGAFFSGLSLLVSALPFIGELPSALPFVPSPDAFARFGPSALCIGIVGQGYLRVRAGHKTIYGTGASWIFSGILLAVGYIFLGLERSGPGEYAPRFDNSEGVLMLAYLAIYAQLAKGFWEMGLFAYAADKKIKPVIAAPPQSLPAALSSWWQDRQRSRKRKETKKANERIGELQERLMKLQQERSALEAEREELATQVAESTQTIEKRLLRERRARRLSIALAFIVGASVAAAVIVSTIGVGP